MSSDSDNHVRLTTAERNSIILNDSRGIQHPLYYVCQTKSGKVQVRKRKTPLVNGSLQSRHAYGDISSQRTTTVQPRSQSTELAARSASSQHAQQHIQESQQQQEQPQEHDHTVNYDSVSNRELLERMLDVLQKNVNSNDENKNSVENERITQENQQFIDNIVKANEPGVAASSSSIPTVHTEQPVVQPTRIVRRGRVLI